MQEVRSDLRLKEKAGVNCGQNYMKTKVRLFTPCSL